MEVRRADPARERADEKLTRSRNRISDDPRLDRPASQYRSPHQVLPFEKTVLVSARGL
ncbi:hypothetical protein [Streptomyces sp. NBC_00878]|uniref:hypothetical protein n=1 Tax=Streptomyces sp. NBC_00878 TaxID=2975854 RepID=UPI00224F355D|nr:hypothetical protein [Streptomyces sp. NBC_00878]MCX4902982.1 hypothetical protein [Streptomyces sp. NBC_00878]